MRVEFREAAKRKDSVNTIYVIDRDDRLLGVVDTKALLLAEDNVQLEDVITTNVVTLSRQSSLKHASGYWRDTRFERSRSPTRTGRCLAFAIPGCGGEFFQPSAVIDDLEGTSARAVFGELSRALAARAMVGSRGPVPRRFLTSEQLGSLAGPRGIDATSPLP